LLVSGGHRRKIVLFQFCSATRTSETKALNKSKVGAFQPVFGNTLSKKKQLNELSENKMQ